MIALCEEIPGKDSREGFQGRIPGRFQGKGPTGRPPQTVPKRNDPKRNDPKRNGTTQAGRRGPETSPKRRQKASEKFRVSALFSVAFRVAAGEKGKPKRKGKTPWPSPPPPSPSPALLASVGLRPSRVGGARCCRLSRSVSVSRLVRSPLASLPPRLLRLRLLRGVLLVLPVVSAPRGVLGALSSPLSPGCGVAVRLLVCPSLGALLPVLAGPASGLSARPSLARFCLALRSLGSASPVARWLGPAFVGRSVLGRGPTRGFGSVRSALPARFSALLACLASPLLRFRGPSVASPTGRKRPSRPCPETPLACVGRWGPPPPLPSAVGFRPAHTPSST